LCHSVLEVVDDPGQVMVAVAATLRTGGAASVLVANRAAAVLARAMAGQLPGATALLQDADGGGPRRFDVESAGALLTKAGLQLEQVHGVRVIADLVPGAVLDRDPDALVAFELASAGRAPYRDIAPQLHL